MFLLKNKIKFIGIGATICALISANISIVSARFLDVPDTHSQIKAIQTLELKKIIQGYNDNTFVPEKLITKAEFLKMLFNDIGFKPVEKNSKTNFEDVPEAGWFAPYIKKALELNIIPGPEINIKFEPNRAITKLEALKMAFIVEGVSAPYYTDVDPDELFSDTTEESRFAYLARAAKKNGIISSKNPDLFTPYKLLTRGDAAELIYQMGITREGPTIEIINLNPYTFNVIETGSAELLNNVKFPILMDVWEKVNKTFYNKSKIDQNQLVYGAIKGLVEELGDQYTVYQEPVEANELNILLQGQFEGIGAVLNNTDKKTIVTKTLPGSPAEKAGVKAGDIIQKVDDKSLENMPLKDVIRLIRGSAGTKIVLTIMRANEIMKIEVTRAKIDLAPINAKMLDNNIAYIAINEYSIGTATLFTKHLVELLAKAPRGFIIDLRSNPGGYLNAAIDILGHFVEEGKTLSTIRTHDGLTTAYNSTGKGELAKYPVVVLINGETASASEIMAVAMQDYKVGKIIGTKSFGKGSVQQIVNYPDRSLLKISIAHWLTPLGKDLDGNGITPDIVVSITPQDIAANKDPQLEKAVEIIVTQ